ncbi:ribonuclease HII, partial [Psychrobacter sp.]|uniref:ribonuclease HII n=1 Tax=Psychrobacter sp. TaxID=56811 RepID=UPI0025CCFADD
RFKPIVKLLIMTTFSLTIKEILSTSSTAQNSLPLPLVDPIKVEGNVNRKHLYHEIQNFNITSDVNGFDTSEQTHSFLEFEIGIDEVGRGPLYGSVVISGAILPNKWSALIEHNPLQDTPLSVLTDSKKLSELKRESLYEPIKQQAIAYATVEIPAAVIDDVNILQATMLGMRVAGEQLMIHTFNAIQYSLKNATMPAISFKLLIDGNKLPDLDWQLLQRHGIGNYSGSTCLVNREAWVKGDARHTAIAAASVLAKVSRDRQIISDSVIYPGYGLESHKGYPTKAHIEAIQKLGVLPQHRRSFKPVKLALMII